MPLPRCQHCGLPLRGGRAGDRFCCQGCALVSRIVGPQENSVHAWTLLRLALGSFLAMDVMMLSLLLYSGGVEDHLIGLFHWLMLGLATPAMGLLAYPFLRGSFGEIRRGRLSMDSLIAIGSLAAYFVSAAHTVAGQGHVYFDTATMLPALVTFGRLIEASAKTQTGKLVHSLETMLPETARVVDSLGERELPLAKVRLGDLLRVRPGERVPADGEIVEGSAVIDDAAFTGESLPRRRQQGERVIAGTVNAEGMFVMRADGIGSDMLLSRIVDQVEQAQSNRSGSERLAERLAACFTPAVLLLSLGAGAFHLLAGHAATAGLSLLAVLVVACPCALGIATPLATSLAVACAARRGVLVRGGDVMERIGKLGRLYLDKTGTLTTAAPAVVSIESYDPAISADELLTSLASVEQASQHPLAKAAVQAAKDRSLPLWELAHAEPLEGGIRGTIVRDGKRREVTAGSPTAVRAMSDGGDSSAATVGLTDDVRPTLQDARSTSRDGNNGIEVAWDGQVRGRVVFSEQLRPGARQMIERLVSLGVEPVLLSGDAAGPAKTIAADLGIAETHAAATPEDKIALLRATHAHGRSISGIVGDGVNDAPALAIAQIGIALGDGTDLARQAGNVVLLSDDLEQIPWLIQWSRRCRRIVVGNMLWAAGYNAVALAAAACGLLHPLLAACAMFISSLSVLANSLRLAKGE